MTYLAVIQHKNPCLRGHETNNLCRPFLNRQYDVRRLSDLHVCSGSFKIHKFYTFSSLGMGFMKFTTFCLLTLKCYILTLEKIVTGVLLKKKLNDDDRRQSKSNRSSEQH